MNGRISKLIRRNARAVAGTFADNPTRYKVVPGTVRTKYAPTGRLLATGLPEVCTTQTCTMSIRPTSLRAFVNEEKRWRKRLGTTAYDSIR